MKFHPFTFLYKDLRDIPLMVTLLRSAERIKDDRIAPWTVFIDPGADGETARLALEPHGAKVLLRPAGYCPWGWNEGGMIKRHGWGVTAQAAADDDMVVHVDSDCVLFNADALDAAKDAEFAGFPHSEMRVVPDLGREWSHKSGCFQVARVECVNAVTRLSDAALSRACQHIAECQLSRIDDVILSYLFAMVGAQDVSLSGALLENDIEAALTRGTGKSIVHLLGDWHSFLGDPVANKWDIPRVLHQKGVYPWQKG